MASASIKHCKNCGVCFNSQNGAYCGNDCYLAYVGRLKVVNAKAKAEAPGTPCVRCGEICRADRKYCCKECYSADQRLGLYARPLLKSLECTRCGKTVKGAKANSNGLFCSRSCYDDHRTDVQKARATDCHFCGESFIPACNIPKKYCSMQCRKYGMKAKPVNCQTCGTLFTAVKHSKATKSYVTDKNQTYCSLECSRIALSTNEDRKEKISFAFRGEKHPLWQGGCGSVRRGYRGPGWNRIAEKARVRDGHECQHCGISQDDHGRKLEVHHKVPFRQGSAKKSNSLVNLLTLCKSCHTKADHKYRRENSVQMVLL